MVKTHDSVAGSRALRLPNRRIPMPTLRARAAAIAGTFVAIVTVGTAGADEPLQIAVTLRNHVFTPSEVVVPMGKPTILVVTNHDAGPEEFDSTALKVEKVIVGGTYVTIRLRPLGPGRYPFMGEFHPDTAEGVVVSR
jgi:hypothetical protein